MTGLINAVKAGPHPAERAARRFETGLRTCHR